MISSDFRAEARRKLSGKWNKTACITLAYVFIFFILGFIQGLLPENSLIYTIFSILVLIIEVPLGFGLITLFLNVYNDKESHAFDFFTLGFNNFSKSWGLFFQILLKVLVPVIILIVSIIIMAIGLNGMVFSAALLSMGSSAGSSVSVFLFVSILGLIGYVVSIIWTITKAYYYMLSYIIAAEDPTIAPKEAVNRSAELMKNNRKKLFCLQLSFIGWVFLAIFTLGIGYLWLLPYIQFSMIVFYKHLNESNNEEENIEASNENPIKE